MALQRPEAADPACIGRPHKRITPDWFGVPWDSVKAWLAVKHIDYRRLQYGMRKKAVQKIPGPSCVFLIRWAGRM